MFPKRLIALTLLASALAVMPPCVLRAQWVEANGLYGQGDEIFVNGSSLFATNASGLFRSTDSGETWTHVFNTTDNNGVESFGGFGSICFLEVTFDATNYRSTDSGVTWTLIPNIFYLQDFFFHDGRAFARGYYGYGLWISNDSGIHWSETLDTLTVSDIKANGTNLFVATSESVWRSTDGGIKWYNPWRSGGGAEWLPDTFYSVDKWGISRIDSIIIKFMNPTGSIAFIGSKMLEVAVYDFGIWDGQAIFGSGRIFVSTDTGAKWTESDSGIRGDNFSFLYTSGSKVFVATDSGIFCSSDSGSTWSQVGNLPNGRAFSFAESGSTFYAASDSGIFRSSNMGKTWLRSYRPGVFPVNSIVLIGDTLYAGSSNGTFRSTDNGLTWSQVGQKTICIMGVGQSIILGQLLNGGDSLYYSTNLGDTWVGAYSGYSGYLGNCFASIGSSFFIGTRGGGVLRSIDSGKSWAPLTGLPDSIVYSLATNGKDLLAGAYEGIYLSEDQGQSWKYISDGLPDSTGSLYYPVIFDGHNIFAGLEANMKGGGLFLSRDNGLTWTECYNATPQYIQTFYVIGSNVLVGPGWGGVQLSTDLGVRWAQDNLGLHYGSGEQISNFVSNDKYLFALSNDGSIYRTPLPETLPPPSAVASTPPTSKAICTHPNPFSQSTQITFTSASAGYADISIVNLLGEQVARIFSGELPATAGGQHSFTFSNTAGLPDGIYECLLRIDGRVETLPMVLLH
jgi:photosystem II stability/assembly factor-like uncharacterized protein